MSYFLFLVSLLGRRDRFFCSFEFLRFPFGSVSVCHLLHIFSIFFSFRRKEKSHRSFRKVTKSKIEYFEPPRWALPKARRLEAPMVVITTRWQEVIDTSVAFRLFPSRKPFLLCILGGLNKTKQDRDREREESHSCSDFSSFVSLSSFFSVSLSLYPYGLTYGSA